ncbi:MAG: GGDEF domain-containing protein [Gammaproteobacteria bacterium]|nr:GGDEF domain-containing protein [Gammaproteobacteria bacterium]MBT8133306.1 GGDEF domain-containing protein [Gammaproteobacteria bacterium]NNJ50049.1 GGDEF domain-containing protein [Gammaproteobacteria bacterium]
MKKNQFIIVLITTLVSVIFLSTLWEFWLESYIGGVFHEEHEAENLSVKLEYVISITIFVTLSLIFPALAGFKLIDNEEQLQEKIKRLSEEDYLTKLYNRRKIHEIIEAEIKRSRRYNSDFAVLLLDIDNFKNINDTHGHNSGDKVLVKLSNILRHNIRESDLASRWGGEEFLVICPETTADGAISLAEKIRHNIEKSTFEEAGTVTASIGVAGIQQGDNVNSLISRADQALYSSKHAGKNRVTMS